MSAASPWAISSADTGRAFETDAERGLSISESERRFAERGPNTLAEAPGISAWSVFFRQFQSLIVWVLIGAAGVSWLLHERLDATVIMAIVLLNAALGFLQEFRAERSLAALKKLSAPRARVVRDGNSQTIHASGLVPGDLVEIEAGDHIPADGRLVWSAAFQTQEASLTGESTPVSKNAGRVLNPDVPVADRLNMVFLGTSAAAGRARMLVTSTGMATELGRIAGLLGAQKEEATPLQRRLQNLGRWLVFLCLGIVFLVFVLGLMRGLPAFDMFLTSVSLAVAAIPEGLPAVVTLALALGVQRMVRRRALIRKLPAVETLGSARVICSDKTGTLTQNEMTVRKIWTEEALFDVEGTGYAPEGDIYQNGRTLSPQAWPKTLLQALRTGVLCNGASLQQKDGRWSVVGDPTEGALLTAAAKAGLHSNALNEAEPREDEIPFDSDRKRMTILRRTSPGWRAYVKGAPDIILERCASLANGQEWVPLDAEQRKHIASSYTALAEEGLRVLAVAYRDFDARPADMGAETIERDLVLAGLIAMQDPPRREAIEAVQRCRLAGIRSVMITGDHPATALAVAKEVGILEPGQISILGTELDGMSDEELARRVEEIAVYARVSALHKLRVVKAWQARHAVVAMTGDGVNDAPALKAADIGVAMGITGTDVTKQAADLVILDDNFASIVSAVEEGRAIYDNIRKFVFYLLSCNTGEVLVMFFAALAGWPLPLLPVHILWLNLVTDGMPALALGLEPPSPDLMRRPVRDRDEKIVDSGFARDMVGSGMVIAACAMAGFGYAYFVTDTSLERARTLGFTVLALAQLVHAYNARSDRLSIYQVGAFSNLWLLAATSASIALQVSIVSWPAAQRVFGTVSLTLEEWSFAVGLALVPLVVVELVKSGRRRFGKKAIHR